MAEQKKEWCSWRKPSPMPRPANPLASVPCPKSWLTEAPSVAKHGLHWIRPEFSGEQVLVMHGGELAWGVWRLEIKVSLPPCDRALTAFVYLDLIPHPSRKTSLYMTVQRNKHPFAPYSVCVLTQSCPTLCNLTDCRPPGSSVHGLLQARILEWVAMPSSRGSSWPRDQT